MLEMLWMKKTESIVLCLMACFSVDICVCVCVYVCILEGAVLVLNCGMWTFL